MKMDARDFGRLVDQLRKIQHPNPLPLLDTTERIMTDDNRQGILKGTDKDGGYMLAVTYRPEGKGETASPRQKNNAKGRRGAFSGFGPAAAGLHNNLTSAEYRKLKGPPLAPRGAFSRVVTNYITTPIVYGPLRFGVVGAWLNVVDAKGWTFLHHHFNGDGRLPKRDLAGIRPEGVKKLKTAFRNWGLDQLRWNKGT